MSWDDDGNELGVDGPTAFPVSRRDFLKLTSTGVLLLMSVDALADQETARPQTGRQGYPTDVNAYLHIGPDNRVTCLSARSSSGRADDLPAPATRRRAPCHALVGGHRLR